MKKLIILSLFNLVFVFTYVFNKNIKVVVASSTVCKISAVEKAFKAQFNKDSIEVISCKVSSNISEQPIGYDIALAGAKNRINNLPDNLVSAADFVVAIESYIEKSTNSNLYKDIGLILLKDLDNKKDTIYLTQATLVDSKFVNLAYRLSDKTKISFNGLPVTVGQAISNYFKENYNREVISNNWHKEPEFANVSREKLIEQAVFKALSLKQINYLKSQIIKYPDFPKPGIVFADCLPIFNNSKAFSICIDILHKYFKSKLRNKKIDVIVGLESRGFIIGPVLAYRLGINFVPLRKPGKLPGEAYSVSYNKEYGTDSLEVSKSALKPNQKVLIVDDLIATGGSAKAAIKLVKLVGANPVGFASLLEVKDLAEQSDLKIDRFNLID